MDVTNRREFLRATATVGAAAAVVGFSSSARAWVGAGDSGCGDFDRVPALDGQLLTDVSTRAAYSNDKGTLVFKTPAAVLRPGSIADVQRMVRFCRDREIKVAARGQAHSTDGQGLVAGGLIIDMATLSTVHEIGAGYAVVDAGATWGSLLAQTLASSQSPPVLTGYQGLSIGGTLSMGGISGMAYKRGVQVQHVLELTVVTGRGTLEVCSMSRNRSLFEAVLAGVGQYAIIVRAKLRLVTVGALVRDQTIRYDDIGPFFDDMRTLVARGEIDLVYGGAKQDPATGAWFYEMYTAQWYDAGSPPNTAYLLRGLNFDPANVVELDGPYFDYHTRVDQGIAFLSSIGLWAGAMKPWFDVFLPDTHVEEYVDDTLTSLAPDDLGIAGFILFFPLKTSTITRPMFRLPDDDVVWLFDVLTANNTPGYEPTFAQAKRARNREWFDRAVAVGGYRYPIGTLDFTRADWRRHYGSEWVRAQVSKAYFDPNNILTPGPGIFDDDC